MATQLIIALDFSSQKDVDLFLAHVDPTICALKVGSELFTTLGPQFIRNLVKKGYRVFLDLKFYDIPNTVAQACKAAADLGVFMMNLHASGGLLMMQKAKEALESYGKEKPLLLAVTVLTSTSSLKLQEIGIYEDIHQQVKRLALLAKQAQVDGVVCSGQEVAMLKTLCGTSFITVTPGIRLPETAVHDQSRVMTPLEAKRIGTDYIVVGRPITQARTPKMMIDTVLSFLV